MSNDTVIQVRIDAKTKNKAVRLFKRFGLSTSDGIRLLLAQAIQAKELPHIPNLETRKAVEDAEAGKTERVTTDGLRKLWDDA